MGSIGPATRGLMPSLRTSACQGSMGGNMIRRLRADPYTSGIPVVIVTGWTAPTMMDRASDLRSVQVLIKPCLPDTLAGELRRTLTGLHESTRHTARL